MVLLSPPINAARGWGLEERQEPLRGVKPLGAGTIQDHGGRGRDPLGWGRWLLWAFVSSLGPFPGDREERESVGTVL